MMSISIDTVALDDFNNADRLGVNEKPLNAENDTIDGLHPPNCPNSVHSYQNPGKANPISGHASKWKKAAKKKARISTLSSSRLQAQIPQGGCCASSQLDSDLET